MVETSAVRHLSTQNSTEKCENPTKRRVGFESAVSLFWVVQDQVRLIPRDEHNLSLWENRTSFKHLVPVEWAVCCINSRVITDLHCYVHECECQSQTGEGFATPSSLTLILLEDHNQFVRISCCLWTPKVFHHIIGSANEFVSNYPLNMTAGNGLKTWFNIML
jgi:hypothetical protein